VDGGSHQHQGQAPLDQHAPPRCRLHKELPESRAGRLVGQGRLEQEARLESHLGRQDREQTDRRIRLQGAQAGRCSLSEPPPLLRVHAAEARAQHCCLEHHASDEQESGKESDPPGDHEERGPHVSERRLRGRG
jgi:hypothetical protein